MRPELTEAKNDNEDSLPLHQKTSLMKKKNLNSR